jgi:hypothetical protein
MHRLIKNNGLHYLSGIIQVSSTNEFYKNNINNIKHFMLIDYDEDIFPNIDNCQELFLSKDRKEIDFISIDGKADRKIILTPGEIKEYNGYLWIFDDGKIYIYKDIGI